MTELSHDPQVGSASSSESAMWQALRPLGIEGRGDDSEWDAFAQVGEEITVGGERVRVVGRWPTAAVIALPDGRARVIVFGPLHD